MEDIITVRFETGDEARAAAASLADSVNENDIFILYNNQPCALDSDRDAVRTHDQGSAKGMATGADSQGIAAGIASTVAGGPARAVAAAVGGYTGSLAGTAGGLPGEGEGANKTSHTQAGLMLAVRVANANNKQQIIDCLRQHVG
ncbi:hypothetical protein SAMN05216412_11522 [Nitrosospira multiformis]|uniref:Uncharacterized protein n=1 Tax=Nitrosospira multiformis TaxID=1231 RepID=A0A1I0GQY1_9PROT|nr:hypothetical protein [Nitrosospira multiformis]SET72823.1 hypothetical protein SAMN05216412_11522 [Nitrosospira multiformis]